MAFLQHRLVRNTSALGVVQLVNYVVPFFILMHLTRVLGVDTYGVVAFAVVMWQVAAVVLDLGFVLSATQKISVFRDRRRFVARFVGAVLAIKLAAFAIVGCVIGTYAMSTQKYSDHGALFLLILLPLLGQTLQPVWFFAGIERLRYVTFFLVGAKLLFLVLVFTLVRSETDYLWVPIADGVSQIAGASLAIALIYKVGYRIALPRRREVRYALKATAGFFLSRVSATAYSNTAVLLLGLTRSPAVVALYSLADQLYKAIQSVFGPVVQAMYPYMVKERDLKLLLWISAACVGTAIIGAIAAFLVAPYLVVIAFGGEWTAALPVVHVFLIGLPIHVLTVMAGYPLAAVLDRTDVANRSVVYGSLVYAGGAAGALLLGIATPIVFAWLVVLAESYVLVHRVTALWPTASTHYSHRSARLVEK